MIILTDKMIGYDQNKELNTEIIKAGFHMTFSNGNTISVQFGFGNYCENNRKSECSSIDAEIAICNENNDWYDFGSDTVKGYCNMDEVAKWINFAATTTF